MSIISRHSHGPLTRYVKLRVAHAPGMPGTFSPSPRVSDPDMQHGTCARHVPWCMPGSPTTGFLWNQWRGKRSRHSRRMYNPQFYVSGKRPMAQVIKIPVEDNEPFIPCMHIPDCKVHGAKMGPTWVLSAPGGPHVGLMNLAILDG